MKLEKLSGALGYSSVEKFIEAMKANRHYADAVINWSQYHGYEEETLMLSSILMFDK